METRDARDRRPRPHGDAPTARGPVTGGGAKGAGRARREPTGPTGTSDEKTQAPAGTSESRPVVPPLSRARRAARATTRTVRRTGRYATGRVRAYTEAQGAGETGLARLTVMHASHTAGDAAMTLALAGTVFLSPTAAEARDKVALFLLLTMVPFVLLAPFIGPALDRFSHGRRWAIGTTMAARAFLCWVLGEAIASDSSWLFPAALGVLVASKSYTVARASAVPRLLPKGTSLVQANARISMAGVAGAVLGGAVAGAAMIAGPAWALRVAFVIFVVGTVQAIRLPARIDSSAGERNPGEASAADVITVSALGPAARAQRAVRSIPWPVRHALWSTGGTRVLTGFLILYLAFLARERPVDGLSAGLVLGLVLGAAGVANATGNVVGSAIGRSRRARHPERVAMVAVLVSVAACVVAAVWYHLWALVVLGLVQGLGAQVSKLCFDALVQRDVEESVRASVFAWSETFLQMMWVVGGTLGIVLPLNPHVGFAVAAVAIAATVVLAARTRIRGTRPAARPVPRST